MYLQAREDLGPVMYVSLPAIVVNEPTAVPVARCPVQQCLKASSN